MAYDPKYMLKELKEMMTCNIKDELKAKRTRPSEWRSIEFYPCGSQVIATRDAVPNGIQEKWNDGRITHKIPRQENGRYFWDIVDIEDKNGNR